MVKFVHVSQKEEALMQKCHSEGIGVRKVSALCARLHATCSQSIGTAPPPRYSRWKIKSEREGSPWRVPRTAKNNVEHTGEVCRMEEINQSVAMGARPLPTINIVRRGAGGSTHGRVDALILFSIHCLACKFCVF